LAVVPVGSLPVLEELQRHSRILAVSVEICPTPHPKSLVFRLAQHTFLSLRLIVVAVVNRAPFERLVRPYVRLVPPVLLIKEVEHSGLD